MSCAARLQPQTARHARIEQDARLEGALPVDCEPWLGTSPGSLLKVFDANALPCLQTASRRLDTAQEPSIVLKSVFEPVIF